MNEQIVTKTFDYFGAWGVSLVVLVLFVVYLIKRSSEERAIHETKRKDHEEMVKGIVERHETRMVSMTDKYDATMKQSVNIISKAAQIMSDFRSND